VEGYEREMKIGEGGSEVDFHCRWKSKVWITFYSIYDAVGNYSGGMTENYGYNLNYCPNYTSLIRLECSVVVVVDGLLLSVEENR
jgi:hypothetical protein